MPNLGCRGLNHLGDLMFHQKNCMRYDAEVGTLSWWSCQSPVAQSCGLLNHLNSFCGRMFKLNAKFDADLLLYSLSHFESEDTKYTCSFSSVFTPLTSTVKSPLFTHVHSSSFSLAYINVAQTVLVILTMAGLFLDRPRIYFLALSTERARSNDTPVANYTPIALILISTYLSSVKGTRVPFRKKRTRKVQDKL